MRSSDDSLVQPGLRSTEHQALEFSSVTETESPRRLLLLPKSWLSVHRCRTEIQSHKGERKGGFIPLPGKEETD